MITQVSDTGSVYASEHNKHARHGSHNLEPPGVLGPCKLGTVCPTQRSCFLCGRWLATDPRRAKWSELTSRRRSPRWDGLFEVRNTYLCQRQSWVPLGAYEPGYNRTRLRYTGPGRQANQVSGRPFPRPRLSSNGPAGSSPLCRLGRCCAMLRLSCLNRASERLAIGMIREVRI
jgi:hypothetical protein